MRLMALAGAMMKEKTDGPSYFPVTRWPVMGARSRRPSSDAPKHVPV